MKREATSKAKFALLVRRIGRLVAAGALELTWHFTAMNRPQGDIGNGFTDEEIESLIGWEGESGKLIEAMIATGWIDRHPTARLVVHGWSEHAEDGVHTMLARRRQRFIDGVAPRTRGLRSDERAKAEAFYESRVPDGTVPEAKRDNPGNVPGQSVEPLLASPLLASPLLASPSQKKDGAVAQREPLDSVPEEFASVLRGTRLEPLLNGSAPRGWWRSTLEMDRRYSGLDVAEKLSRLGRWLAANPDKGPHKRIASWVTNRLSEDVDRGLKAGSIHARTFTPAPSRTEAQREA